MATCRTGATLISTLSIMTTEGPGLGDGPAAVRIGAGQGLALALEKESRPQT